MMNVLSGTLMFLFLMWAWLALSRGGDKYD
jgi:hypothetical protein